MIPYPYELDISCLDLSISSLKVKLFNYSFIKESGKLRKCFRKRRERRLKVL